MTLDEAEAEVLDARERVQQAEELVARASTFRTPRRGAAVLAEAYLRGQVLDGAKRVLADRCAALAEAEARRDALVRGER